MEFYARKHKETGKLIGFYALKHKETGKMMRLHVVNNPADAHACNDTYVTLVPSDSYNEFVYALFTTQTYEEAERVANHSEKRYNTTVRNPENDYVGELEVVKFIMTAVNI